jgi:rSAM-associated Gly-rich repeat protein
MAIRRKTKKALAMLLPTGMLGISSALASVHPQPLPHERNDSPERVSAVGDRLRDIRSGVSEMNALAQKAREGEPDVLMAAWLNGGFGWRNGGWGNGGFRNGGWGNGGFHNGGWGNGGWHNAPNWGNGGWGNGWHNAPNWGNGGWHNFWHNW